MSKPQKGRAGCGCLLFVLIACMIFAAAMVHPFSLKIIAGRLRHEDKLVPCDAIYVPRFVEDKDGEVYADAFREYWAGNGKTIWVENDHVLGLSLKDLVARMAKERGIKDAGAVRAIDVEGDEAAKAHMAMEALTKHGVRKLIVVVPDYSSKRYQMLYAGEKEGGGATVLIKPVHVSYFKLDKWWRDEFSRSMMEKEVLRTAMLIGKHFRSGKEPDQKTETPDAR